VDGNSSVIAERILPVSERCSLGGVSGASARGAKLLSGSKVLGT